MLFILLCKDYDSSYLDVSMLTWKDILDLSSKGMISFLHIYYIVEKGYLYYLDYVWDTSVGSPPLLIYDRVIYEFIDVFPMDFLGMPPYHNMNFAIDVVH